MTNEDKLPEGIKSEPEEEIIDDETTQDDEPVVEDEQEKNKTADKFDKILAKKNKTADKFKKILAKKNDAEKKLKELEDKLGIDWWLQEYIAEKVIKKTDEILKTKWEKEDYIKKFWEDLLTQVEEKKKQYPWLSFNEAHVLITSSDKSYTRNEKWFGMVWSTSRTVWSSKTDTPNKFKQRGLKPQEWYK